MSDSFSITNCSKTSTELVADCSFKRSARKRRISSAKKVASSNVFALELALMPAAVLWFVEAQQFFCE
jgi:hypothetical protein